jgi:hypothetical protein
MWYVTAQHIKGSKISVAGLLCHADLDGLLDPQPEAGSDAEKKAQAIPSLFQFLPGKVEAKPTQPPVAGVGPAVSSPAVEPPAAGGDTVEVDQPAPAEAVTTAPAPGLLDALKKKPAGPSRRK